MLFIIVFLFNPVKFKYDMKPILNKITRYKNITVYKVEKLKKSYRRQPVNNFQQ